MLLLAIIISMCLWLFLRYRRMTLLQRCSIPGPSPNFFLGNMTQFYAMGSVNYHTYLSQTYGSICGYYIGGKPFILITEPVLEGRDSLMIEMFNSQSKHFLGRLRRVPGGINADPLRNLMLGNLPIDRWRNTRKILQSAFTSNRLKDMIPQITSVTNTFITELQETIHTEIDMCQVYQRFVINLITKIIFGFNTNDQSSLTDKLVNISHQETRKSKFVNHLLLKVYFIFPEFDIVFKWLRILAFYLRMAFAIEKRSQLWNIAKCVTKLRREFIIKNKQINCQEQFVDILINSQLTDSEIGASFIVFFESVFDNLSSGLSFFTHILLTDKEVQHLLREEVRKEMAVSKDINYQSIANLKLMDSAITEMFRLYAPETVLSRTCDCRFQYKNYKIPKGIHLAIGTYQLHRCEKVWKEPDRFLIDRFLNVKYVNSLNWQAFGAGPRQCFGFQFTYYVMKLLFSQMLIHFELTRTNNTESQLSLEHKVATITPSKGLRAMLLHI